MSRRRFAYTIGGRPLHEPVEVTEDFQATSERMPLFTDRFMEGGVAPDGTDIGSRQKRRSWMAATGSADASDFSPQFYARVRAEREKPAPGLREALREALHKTRRR
jgi:hypothetical protein